MPDDPKAHVCKICGTDHNTVEYCVKEMMFGFRDTFRYFQCRQCECLQIVTFPDNISSYYPAHYYSLQNYGGGKFKGIHGIIRRITLPSSIFYKTLGDKIISKLFPAPSLSILQELPVTTGTRILDVGCGNGYKFLYPLAEVGFDALLGCDPYIQQSLNYPNGLQVLQKTIFSIEGEWDVITYHHSFEHLENPFDNLKRVRKLLAPDGVCIIRIPVVSSYAWEHFKTNWFQIDAPRHYFLYSRKSVDYMAGEVGLKLFKTIYDSTYKQFSESEKYASDTPLRQQRKKGFSQFLKRKLKKNRYQRWAKRLNESGRGDQAAFFFRK